MNVMLHSQLRRHREQLPRPAITANAQKCPTVVDLVSYAPYSGPSSCTLGRGVQHCTLRSMHDIFRLVVENT